MSRRVEMVWCLVAVALAVIARGVLFMQPGVRMDADQAIVGLMAKHISEGRAFPLYFYGQSYLLAVEAYLAAPVMWILGPTEVALKLPIVVMNVAGVSLLLWHAHRDLGLRPLVALAGAAPLVIPPAVPGTRVMEAMGGNAELLLCTMLIWRFRTRVWPFALSAGFALAHREIAAYGLAALVLLDVARGAFRVRATWTRWALAAVCFITLTGTTRAVLPYSAMFGPDSRPHPSEHNISSAEAVRAQICLVPERWPQRWSLLVTEHWPWMVGGRPGPWNAIGVSTGVGQGNPGLGPWVLVLTIVSLAGGLATAWKTRPSTAGHDRGDVDTGFAWYLLLVGLISTSTYWLVTCAQITQNSLRYDLLVLLVPVGALLAGLRVPAVCWRAGLATATTLWVALSASDYGALAAEVRAGKWPDHRGRLVQALEARGLTVAWGEFRLAYVVTFRSQERVRLAATTIHRVDEYARLADMANAPFVRQGVCAGGEALAPPDYTLCPPPPPDRRPPIY